MEKLKIKIKKLSEDAIIPKYQTSGSSGFDLHALEDIIIKTGETKLIKTGLAFEIPEGFELQVRPRSGLSLKSKLRICNAPGTVDSDFRNEVCIIMEDTGYHLEGEYHIKKGDRIAQGVICPIFQAEFEEVEHLNNTNRQGGFGSTGA